MRALASTVAVFLSCSTRGHAPAPTTPAARVRTVAPAEDYIRELPAPKDECELPADCSFVRSL